VALALWLGLVSFLAFQGAFVKSANSPPLPIFFGVAIPLAVFLAAYFGSSPFRDFILGADLRFVAAIEAWRWGGLGMLSLYANGVLPGLFALPAGLGDMAIGISAPWIVLSLIRNPLFAASRRFVIWNILGIADFVVAVSMGALSSGAFPRNQWAYWKRHHEPNDTITLGAHPGVYGPILYYAASHSSFPSAAIGPLWEIDFAPLKQGR
jgi:hypothetical protein